ncbi:NADH-quinone oxidoreductase subunit K [Meridianimarinicoccus sp. RP-17]|uniref:NADH-quinone oxidoreductase subunit K n=1 Tax=Meridianimarinicoccus zhengii TaxID=2056810 RepID=UPI000DAC6A02|nr:NADH-quinone oxidoreductase subunit K [Phycocomes zhengii]
MTPETIYGATGIALFAIGLYHALVLPSALRRIVALNVASVGAGFVMVIAAWRPGGGADPVPHALVITGIVVLVAATAVALALVRALHDADTTETDDTP